MTAYLVGQTLAFGLTVRDENGALADLGGGLPSATVTGPDATTSAATVAKTATGTYTATLASTMPGRYRITWTGSGANSGGLPYTDLADVLPADPRLIISLADAREALNVQPGVTVNDDELLGYLASATVVVEHLCGPVLPATRTETRTGGGRQSLPLHEQAATVTSVVEDGTTLTADQWCVDEHSIVWRGSAPGAATWSAAGARNVTVTYTVGDQIISPNVIEAASHLVAHWWRQTQQAPRPMLGIAPDPGMRLIAGYAVPNFVIDLLAPSDTRMPGIA